ncbi:MAG: hypothetical protein AB7E60_09060 [Sphingobium sp.]
MVDDFSNLPSVTQGGGGMDEKDMGVFRLTREDSTDIGFATTCLTLSAVSFDEFRDWLYHVIGASDEWPDYLLDILDLKQKFDYTLHVRRILGFIPGANLSDDEYRAVDGIAYRRFPRHQSDGSTKETALTALARNPRIEQLFRTLFFAIDW